MRFWWSFSLRRTPSQGGCGGNPRPWRPRAASCRTGCRTRRRSGTIFRRRPHGGTRRIYPARLPERPHRSFSGGSRGRTHCRSGSRGRAAGLRPTRRSARPACDSAARSPRISASTGLPCRGLSEEEGECLPPAEFASVTGDVASALRELIASYDRARVWAEGAPVALAGRVNAGKSSLMNALLGRPRAIVTDQPGTTRDYLEEECRIQGLPVRLVDTAGLREDSEDPIEREGIRRGKEKMREAGLLLLILDGSALAPCRRRILRPPCARNVRICPICRLRAGLWYGTSRTSRRSPPPCAS